MSAAAAAITVATYQQPPTTFRCHFITPAKLSYSTTSLLPNLSMKLAAKPRGCGIKMADKSSLDYFTNPIVTLEAKRALIDDVTASGKLQIHVCNFLNILIESKRIDLIREIINEFELVYNKLTNTELAIVSSVVPLEKQHLSQLAKQVQKLTGAKCVRLKTVIDESLVAGFTIRYGNSGSKLIDMSVKKQLDEIAAQLEIVDANP